MESRSTNTIALKKIMIDQGLERIIELSNASGISRNTLSNVLNGKSQPSADVMGKLIATLKMQPSRAGEIFFDSNLHNAQV